MDQRLPKHQRIYKQDDIDHLFSKGKAVISYPLRAVFCNRHDDQSPRMMVSVAKRRFKHAVDRVRFKRLIREAYRRNKPQQSYDIAFVAISDKLPSYQMVEKAVCQILQKIQQAETECKTTNS
ncbi:MAG: ribonuclease P protein component [Paludibacteraceae bacterium]|nr:ribonuclease P protein component [Paludibacteraceae bacterium]